MKKYIYLCILTVIAPNQLTAAAAPTQSESPALSHFLHSPQGRGLYQLFHYPSNTTKTLDDQTPVHFLPGSYTNLPFFIQAHVAAVRQSAYTMKKSTIFADDKIFVSSVPTDELACNLHTLAGQYSDAILRNCIQNLYKTSLLLLADKSGQVTIYYNPKNPLCIILENPATCKFHVACSTKERHSDLADSSTKTAVKKTYKQAVIPQDKTALAFQLLLLKKFADNENAKFEQLRRLFARQ